MKPKIPYWWSDLLHSSLSLFFFFLFFFWKLSVIQDPFPPVTLQSYAFADRSFLLKLPFVYCTTALLLARSYSASAWPPGHPVLSCALSVIYLFYLIKAGYGKGLMYHEFIGVPRSVVVTTGWLSVVPRRCDRRLISECPGPSINP